MLRRSLFVLKTRTELVLPDDIEAMVEAVYTGAASPEWASALEVERVAFETEREREESLAATRVWRAPNVADDPFGDLHMELEEDDPRRAWELRAETRLGDPTAEVVCLFDADGQLSVDRHGARPIDLAKAPDRETVRRLAGRTVRVATRGLVQELMQVEPPAPWREVSVLSRRRPLVFGNGPVSIGNHQLELDPELGLLISRTTKGAARVVSADD